MWAAAHLPEVDDVAHQIDGVGLVLLEKFEEPRGLSRAGAQVHVGYEEGSNARAEFPADCLICERGRHGADRSGFASQPCDNTSARRWGEPPHAAGSRASRLGSPGQSQGGGPPPCAAEQRARRPMPGNDPVKAARSTLAPPNCRCSGDALEPARWPNADMHRASPILAPACGPAHGPRDRPKRWRLAHEPTAPVGCGPVWCGKVRPDGAITAVVLFARAVQICAAASSSWKIRAPASPARRW